MKKWAPYKSLNEQEKYLNKVLKENSKEAKPKISSDEAEIINEILVNYRGQELSVSYWRNDKINIISTVLMKIDPIDKKIILSEKRTILFSEIITIKEI